MLSLKQKSIILLLVLLFILSPFTLTGVNRAEAIVHGSIAQWLLTTKETILDGIAWQIANLAVEEMADRTIDWINNGFDGKPAYVQDFGGYLVGVGDDAVGEFINQSDFGFVCDPFKFQIRASLARARVQEQRFQCSLSDVVNNVENFIAGDFYDGGWLAWGELVTRSNPYTQYLQAESDLELFISNRLDLERTKLNWGGGFFGWETCPENRYTCKRNGVVIDTSGRATREQCERAGGSYICEAPLQQNTPGSVINSQLNNVLDSGNRRLQVADEIDEIIGALLNSLVESVFNSVGGLLESSPRQHGFTQPNDPSVIGAPSCIEACNIASSCGGASIGDAYGEVCDEDRLDVCISTCASSDDEPGNEPGDGSGGGTGVCRDTGFGFPDYEPDIGLAIRDVRGPFNPPTLDNPIVDVPNTFANRAIFLDAIVASLQDSGLSATVDVLNGHDNPGSAIDLIAVWSEGDQSMERYDILIGGDSSNTIRQLIQIDFTGDISLTCTVGSTPTPPPEGAPGTPPTGGLPSSLESEVAALRSSYGASLHWTEAVDILLTIAWNNKADGWGLSGKNFGTHCPSSAGDIACDILHHQPSNTIYDVFGAGPDPDDFPFSSGDAQWDSLGMQTNPSRPWVAPVQP